MKNKNSKLILFDLDGVIIDSEKNMQAAWEEVRTKFNINIRFENYRKFVGLPFFKVLRKLKIKNNFELVKRIFDYGSIKNISLIKLYPNTRKTLRLLNKRKYKVGLVTSKDSYRTKIILKKLRLSFKHVIASKPGIRGKPFPNQLNKAIKLFNFKKKENVFYVGDTLIDQKFAKNANVNYIHANYGFEKKKVKCNSKIKNLIEIFKFI